MTIKTELKYEIPNLSMDITYTGYRFIQGKLEAYKMVYDFINNSKSNIKPNEILVFITDLMTKEGAYRMEIQDTEIKSK